METLAYNESMQSISDAAYKHCITYKLDDTSNEAKHYLSMMYYWAGQYNNYQAAIFFKNYSN